MFPWIWSLSSDGTKQNDVSFVKNFHVVSQCEEETGKKKKKKSFFS